MGRVLIISVVVLLAIYSIVELAQANKYEVRVMPRWLWFAVICLPGIGPVCWLLFGRPVKSSRKISRGEVAPDDDPDFLRKL